MNIESEHINAENRTKNYHSTLIFLCFQRCPLVPTMVAPQVDPRFGITQRITKLEL